MVFSDTTNKNGLLQDCEKWCRLGDGAITGDSTLKATFTEWINEYYHKAITIIDASKDGEDFDDPNLANQGFRQKFNLVANQPYVDIDVQTNKIYKVRRADITYDGTNWYKSEPLDQGEFGKALDTTTIANNFVTTEPYHEQEGRYWYTYPIPTINVTSGLELWFSREIDEFLTTDTTQAPGIDKPFHTYLSKGASLNYAVIKGLDNKNDLAALIQDMEARMKVWYANKESDRKLRLSSAYEDYE